MNSKKVYESVNELGSMDYLIIEQNKNSISGYWIGTEETVDHGNVHYVAPAENLTITENKISFTVSDYKLSSQSISPTSMNVVPLENQTNLPLFAAMTLYFTGEIDELEVTLLRTSDLHDSNADNLKLKRQAN